MSCNSNFLIFFLGLGLLVILTGCLIPEGKTGPVPQENTTSLVIGIALNNTTVQSCLTEEWTISGVALNATWSMAGGGEEISLQTPDVIIDTPSRYLHVYVDPGNRTVVGIWNSPKRAPLPE